MNTRIASWMLFSFSSLLAFAAMGAAMACSGSDSADPGPKSSGDDAGTPPAPPPNPPPPPGDDGGDGGSGYGTATFAYAPSWAGVAKVEVLGAFGKADDWKNPLLTLTNDGAGTFRGSAVLPNGTYPYVFRVTGDAAAAKAATFVHYAIDPGAPTIVDCPSGSPTYTKAAPNPCSTTSVPQGAPIAPAYVHGVVKLAGAPVAGYLVVLERMEPGSHHFFVDRSTTGANGMFKLGAVSGNYRLQVLHPTFYMQTDAQRDPEALGAARRAISSGFSLATDVNVMAAEVGFDGYAAMTPRGNATLPVTLSYSLASGATKASAAIYGTGDTIGDPWWSSAATTATTATFDGGWNTKAAPPDAGIEAGARYFWGTEQIHPGPDGGVQWTTQSMVYPLELP